MDGHFDIGLPTGQRWKILSRLSHAEGFFNRGIHVVQDTTCTQPQPCVMKVLPSQAMYAGFAKREIDILYALRSHANIIQVHDSYVPTDRHSAPWTVTELCDAGTLKQCLLKYHERRLPVPEMFMWHVLESLLSAVLYCLWGPAYLPHGVSDAISHRDIIPGNIFLASTNLNDIDSYPTVKLADFGCAVSLSENVGCELDAWKDLAEEDPKAVPPEGPYPSEAADIYQIGLILRKLLDSRIDFRYSRDIQCVVNLCIRVDPSQRLLAAELLQVVQEYKLSLMEEGGLKYEPLVL